MMSCFARVFSHNRGGVPVLAYPGKFAVPKMIDLRFILHLYVA
jgi:hypothetical protein